ncbi:hypothetical protein V6N11_080587 [Hibiscus sabdariffa]|uniref:Uncharacterized protein n=1 Tax=Hibiscus sabdariffa TaxID=183260 RepID=A0ABR2R857_9ROSI
MTLLNVRSNLSKDIIVINSYVMGESSKDGVNSQNEGEHEHLPAEEASSTPGEEITMKSLLEYMVNCRDHVDSQFVDLRKHDSQIA